MPRRQQSYPEKPWKPDPAKWAKLLPEQDGGKFRPPLQPKEGWQLWRWDTLADAPQNERP